MKRLISALALILDFVAASVAISQTAAAPKTKSVSCAPECGFQCRSHDEQELIEIVKAHAKRFHNKTVTDQQVKEMMKADAGSD